jgi:AcrR family transcriptional regulator
MVRETSSARTTGPSGRLPRRRPNAAVTPEGDVRDRILRSAADCFKRYGVRRARMEDIAVGAGMVRPTLYRYFPTKEALLLEVMTRQARLTNEHRLGRLRLEGPFATLLVDAVMAGFEMTRRDKYIQALFADDVVDITARLIEEPTFLDADAEFWDTIFDYGRAQGELRPDVTNRDLLRGITYVQFFMSSNKVFFPGAAQARWFLQTFVLEGLLARDASN